MLLFVSNSYSQSQYFNLKNLNSLSVNVQDNTHLLSNTTTQKILSNIKLKLMSAGIKIGSLEKSEAHMVIKVDYIRSNFASQRMFVQLDIYEHVSTNRKGDVKTSAITYNDYSLFRSTEPNTGIYNDIMNHLFVNFINKYINQMSS